MLHKDTVLSCIIQMYISYDEYDQEHIQEFFIAVEILGEKGAIYARYYRYIISAIYNTLTSVTKTNHSMTFMIEVLVCLFRYIFIYRIATANIFITFSALCLDS